MKYKVSPPHGLAGLELECVGSDVGPLWFPVSDRVMRPFIARRGTWEASEGQLLARFFRPGLRFLDVGANVGYFSRLVAARCPGAVIDACEPHPVTFGVLQLNLWIGASQVHAWPVALGRGERAAVLSMTRSNWGDTRSEMTRLEGVRADLVAAAVAGDELFADRRFDLVKIDVQGAEAAVVAGLADTIRRSAGIAIVAEFWPHALRAADTDPRDVLGFYRGQGFRVVTHARDRLALLDDDEILRICDSGGPDGQVNLLLRRP